MGGSGQVVQRDGAGSRFHCLRCCDLVPLAVGAENGRNLSVSVPLRARHQAARGGDAGGRAGWCAKGRAKHDRHHNVIVVKLGPRS